MLVQWMGRHEGKRGMNREQFDLSGRTAVVTGAGRGLARAMALGLADAGARVVAAARTAGEVEDTAAAIRERGGEAIAVAFDATRREDCERLMDESVAAFGSIEIALVGHGASSGPAPAAEDVGEAEFGRIMAVNVAGCFNCAQLAARRMIAQGHGGAIILVSSTASLVGFPGLLAYGVSKGGVDQMVRQMAVEWGVHGIRVNAINPGYTTHHMRGSEARNDDEALEARIADMTPMGRRGQPAEFAGPAVFLASDASSFVTGVVLPVDGGYCAL